MTMTFVLNGSTSDFTISHNSVMLMPGRKYEAALLSLDVYNSIPNVTVGKNNIFKYSVDNGVNWKINAFKTGAYELQEINKEIKRQMKSNDDNDAAITIVANVSRLTSIINIASENYKIDFNVPNSIGPILGFGAQIIGYGYTESPNIVDIMAVNSIMVNIDIVMGSYVNGFPSPTIYSFYPNVSPGYKIVERPNPSLIYYPLSRDDISRMRVWLTDQHGNLIDFRGERITIRICVREAKSGIIDTLKRIFIRS